MLANYTWSHCISDPQTTELSAPITTNPTNCRYDRGNCSFIDVHHNFNFSGVLQSPHFSSRALQWIAGNWQLAPIIGIHSGSYFTVTTGLDNALNGAGYFPRATSESSALRPLLPPQDRELLDEHKRIR